MQRIPLVLVLAFLLIPNLLFGQASPEPDPNEPVEEALDFDGPGYDVDDLYGDFAIRAFSPVGGGMVKIASQIVGHLHFDGEGEVHGVLRTMPEQNAHRTNKHLVEGTYFVRSDGTGLARFNIDPIIDITLKDAPNVDVDVVLLEFAYTKGETFDFIGSMYLRSDPPSCRTTIYLTGTARRQHPTYDTIQLNADQLRR